MSDVVDSALEGGFSEAWEELAAVEQLKCPICLQVPRDAVAHLCGELFCEMCWLRWLGEEDRCPHCRQDSKDVAPAFHERRRILNLNIRCELCSDVLRLGDKPQHAQETCRRREVACNICTELVPHEELDEHRRMHCSGREVSCPACGATTTHRELQVHRTTDCPFLMVLCCVCEELVAKDDLEDHYQASAGHVSALLQEVAELKREVGQLRLAHHDKTCGYSFSTRGSQTWHPGVIRPLPNGISRKNGCEIDWEGYTFDHFDHGWSPRHTLRKIYGDSTWSCCGGGCGSAPCAVRPAEIATASSSSAGLDSERNSRVAWHPGTIRPAPNGISRIDDEEEILFAEGYVFDEFLLGWRPNRTFDVIYEASTWSCCGRPWDGAPCGVRLHTGDMVKVSSNSRWVRERCALIWDCDMDVYCGKVGRVRAVDHADKAAEVEFLESAGGKTRWWYAAEVLSTCPSTALPEAGATATTLLHEAESNQSSDGEVEEADRRDAGAESDHLSNAEESSQEDRRGTSTANPLATSVTRTASWWRAIITRNVLSQEQ